MEKGAFARAYCALIALIPNVPVIQLLLVIQVLNGLLLPVILIFMLLLINDERVVGDLRNTRWLNVLGWSRFTFVTVVVLMMLGAQIIEPLG